MRVNKIVAEYCVYTLVFKKFDILSLLGFVGNIIYGLRLIILFGSILLFLINIIYFCIRNFFTEIFFIMSGSLYQLVYAAWLVSRCLRDFRCLG